MDDLRGQFGTVATDDGGGHDAPVGDEDIGREPPPSPVGQDERRMQVRAYNHWASLLGNGNFPSIEDLDPQALTDFGPFSVLLDFTGGIDNPAIRYLGETLASECDVQTTVGQLDDVPSRSLLSRITDHYLQIIANQAPIGFEAEFVNQRGATILYRGILLPFSSDEDTIDFIYGVINWKEMADRLTSDELLLEIDQALGSEAGPPRLPDPVTDWADGPGADVRPADPDGADAPFAAAKLSDDPFPLPSFGNDGDSDAEEDDEPLDLYEAIEAVDDEEPEGPSRFASLLSLGGGNPGTGAFDDEDDDDAGDGEDPVARWLNRPAALDPLPEPQFGPKPLRRSPIDLTAHAAGDERFVEFAPEPRDDPAHAVEPEASAGDDLPDGHSATAAAPNDRGPGDDPAPAFDTAPGGAELGLYDCLAVARELAHAARNCEDRSRTALYAAVGRAYDFSLAAQAEPEAFAELVADSGLTFQERAPMTPVVKLVFGADYDKTRIAEYASVLNHAHRVGIERGTLADYLGRAEGGLKGVVQAEREARKADSGDTAHETPREALARKLRGIAPLGFEDLAREGEEFALVMIRRVAGEVVVLGEIADAALVEKAARKLVA